MTILYVWKKMKRHNWSQSGEFYSKIVLEGNTGLDGPRVPICPVVLACAVWERGQDSQKFETYHLSV